MYMDTDVKLRETKQHGGEPTNTMVMYCAEEIGWKIFFVVLFTRGFTRSL